MGFAQEMEEDPVLYLLYREQPDRTRTTTWEVKDFNAERRVNRERERSDDPARLITKAYTIDADDFADGATGAYLIACAE